MTLRLHGWLSLLALLAPACGGSSPGGDGGDLSAPADLGRGPLAADLAEPADLARPPDLTGAPDLARSSDLAGAPDLGSADLRSNGCRATMGYSGGNGMVTTCGLAGSCGGVKYAMDCDGNVCACTVDGARTAAFPQLATCSNQLRMDEGWTKGCMF